MKIENMFSSFKNAKGKTIGYIDIFGPIGSGWGENGAKDFIAKYRELEKTCSQIVLNMSTEGGEVFIGQQIASQILSSKTYTICHIQALCASIGTVIACACDKVVMPKNSLFMSHSPSSGMRGNARDMRELAKLLDKIEETILNIYENKCKGKTTRDELQKIISGEDGSGTWMTAQEAFDIGFVDEISHELVMVAQLEDPSNAIINGVKMDLSGYQNLDKVRELFENKCQNDKGINDIEETNMSEQEKVSSAFDTITGYVKNMLGIKNEAVQEPEIKVEQPQEELEAPVGEEAQETPEVPTEDVAQEESQPEDAEALEEPSEEAPEEIQGEEPAGSEEPQEEPLEPEAEQPEELEAPQEEPVEDEPEAGNEPPVEAEDSIVPEVSDSADLAKQLVDMKAKIDALTQEKDIIVAKAELTKEVENKFKGVPGKLEDVVDKIYNIKNSNLSDTEKEFILNGLSQLSKQNLEDCEEIGHSEKFDSNLSDEDKVKNEVKQLMSKHTELTELQAISIVKKDTTLEKALDVSKKVKK